MECTIKITDDDLRDPRKVELVKQLLNSPQTGVNSKQQHLELHKENDFHAR